MNDASSRADSGFSYSRADFEQLVDLALSHARSLGATDAGAEASEGCGLSVSVRKGELAIRIGAEYALADAAEAHRALEGRKTTGKVLLVP